MKSWFTLISLACTLFCSAQEIGLKTELDTNQIRIGEQTVLRISAFGLEKSIDIVWPEIKDTLNKNIEVIEALPIDTLKNDKGAMVLQFPIIITSWDSGYYAIRPMKFKYGEKAYETEALLLSVNTVQVDTTSAPMDIKPIYQEPFSVKDWLQQYWPYLLALLIALLIVVYILQKKRKSAVDVFGPKPIVIIPPHEKAMARLKALQESGSIEDENKKPYYSELTDTVRAYLEERYRIKALEQTSSEILDGIKYVGVDSGSSDYLRSLLLTADMVKFAKERPSSTVAGNHLQRAFEFIEKTQTIEKDISENNE